MNSPSEYLTILATAVLASATAIGLTLTLVHREGAPTAWTAARKKLARMRAFDATMTALLSPIILLVTGAFLVTAFPAVILMLPFFAMWAMEHRGERVLAPAVRRRA